MSEIQRLSFDRAGTSLTVCHDDGFAVYDFPESIADAEMNCVFKSVENKRVLIAERLSALMMLVTGDKLRCLTVYHLKRREVLLTHNFTSSIKAVKLNRNRCVVCLESTIHVYDPRKMERLHTIDETAEIHDGIVDLSLSDDHSYVAYPSMTPGHVNLFDTAKLTTSYAIPAHESDLAAIKFNQDGTLLATASTKGTVIRVFAVPSAERLFEFTRGVRRYVTIHSLAFSADSKYLCTSSNTETVHIFSLDRTDEPPSASGTNPEKPETSNANANEQSWAGYLAPYVTSYLPQQVHDIMLRRGSFATAYLPNSGTKTACAMPRINDKDYVIVANTDGTVFCYDIPAQTGACTLVNTFKVSQGSDENQQMSDGTAMNTAITVSPSVDQDQE